MSGGVASLESANLGDLALHNDKIGVVDIELHGLKDILNLLLARFVSVEKIFRNIG